MKITIFGAGSFGTAIAYYLAHFKKHEVLVWGRNQEKIEIINSKRENIFYLQGVRLPESVFFSSSIDEAIKYSKIYLIAMPFQSIKSFLNEYCDNLILGNFLINLSKGIDIDSGFTFSEMIYNFFPNLLGKICTLSGPTHAEEIVKGIPSLMVITGNDETGARYIQDLFSSDTMRIYVNMDTIGVELGGALKNIYAIGAGIIDGLSLGDNTKSGFICRAIEEVKRFFLKKEANVETVSGIAFLGDLIATSFSKHSRNRYVGENIGKGMVLGDILSGMNMVAEGVWTLKAVKNYIDQNSIDMPIANSLYDILFNGVSPIDAMRELMTRPLKKEFQ